MIWLITVLITCCTIESWSKCDSLLQTASADSGFSVGKQDAQGGTVTLTVDDFGPQFVFGYEADSSYTRWTFAEFLLNRKKLFLSNWCMKRRINYDTATSAERFDWTEIEMRARSITKTFPIHGNDTIQFYRNLKWTDRLTSGISYSRYVNPNGLAFSVELVNANFNSRLILLDTFYISPTTVSKKPCIYSWYPMASRVRSVIPNNYDSIDVFIRINVWTSGANPKLFVRGDTYGYMMSAADLASAGWRNYSDSVEANTGCSSPTNCLFSVSTLSNPPGLNVGYDWPMEIDQIRVCNIYGEIVWSSTFPLASNPLSVTLSPNMYIVLGIKNGQVMCTKKIYLP